MLLSAAGGAYWPLTTSPCPFLEPSSSVGSSAHRPLTPPLCPPSPCLPSLRPLPFPWEAVPTEPPDCPCFTVGGGGGGHGQRFGGPGGGGGACAVDGTTVPSPAPSRSGHDRQPSPRPRRCPLSDLVRAPPGEVCHRYGLVMCTSGAEWTRCFCGRIQEWSVCVGFSNGHGHRHACRRRPMCSAIKTRCTTRPHQIIGLIFRSVGRSKNLFQRNFCQ